MNEPLKESVASAIGSHLGAETASSQRANRIIFSVAGPGFSDSEEFDIADLRAARAGARKLMASAIRLFGKAEGADPE